VSATAGSGTPYYLSPSVSAIVPTAGTYPSVLQSTFNLTMNSYAAAPMTINLRQNTGGSGTGCAFTGTTMRNAALDVEITGGPAATSFVVNTMNGTVNVLVPTGSTPYTVTVANQAPYAGTGTIVVSGTSTCNLQVG
jgi:hypothetical protein